MKKRIVSVVFLLLFFVPFTPSIAENDCIVPTAGRIETFLDDEMIYFTYPSSDQSNLVLWYADRTGVHETKLMFPSSTLLRSNPTGSHIVAIEYEDEFYLYGDEVYEVWGSKLTAIRVVEERTMRVVSLSLPEDWDDVAFIRRVVWIDGSTIMLISKIDHHIAASINIVTGESETLDWLNGLPYRHTPYIPSSGGGIMSVSPSGEYLYFTLADPFVPSIHWAIMPEYGVLPWTIVNWNGEVALDYIGGVGFFASWFDKESIITLDAESNNLLRISLDGTVQNLTKDPTTLYYKYLTSPNGAKVALTTEVDERDGFHQEQPAILNVANGEITHYCVNAIQIGKESWSTDARLLIYVAYSISDGSGGTDIFALDTIDNTQISLLPERIKKATIGIRFVHVVGINN